MRTRCLFLAGLLVAACTAPAAASAPPAATAAPSARAAASNAASASASGAAGDFRLEVVAVLPAGTDPAHPDARIYRLSTGLPVSVQLSPSGLIAAGCQGCGWARENAGGQIYLRLYVTPNAPSALDVSVTLPDGRTARATISTAASASGPPASGPGRTPTAPATAPIGCFTSAGSTFACRIETFAGIGPPDLGDGGPAAGAVLADPRGLAVGADGSILVADTGDHRVRRISPTGTISTFAGTGSGEGRDFTRPGPASEVSLRFPRDVTFGPDGLAYIADTNHYAIRRVDTDGTMVTVAGGFVSQYSGDGGPALRAGMTNPVAIALDAAGNIFISEQYGSRIRVVTTAGSIDTIAGTGDPAISPDGVLARGSSIRQPGRLVVDRARALLYFLESGHQGGYAVRRIDLATGMLSSIPELATGSPCLAIGDDGALFLVLGSRIVRWDPVTMLVFTIGVVDPGLQPSGIGVGASGVYFADAESGTVRRAAASASVVIAGGGSLPGDGVPAARTVIYDTQGIAADRHGGLLVGDFPHHVIRRIGPDGIIRRVAGNGVGALDGDGGPALAAALGPTGGYAIDAAGALLFLDETNGTGVVRRIAPGADGAIDGSSDEIITRVAGSPSDRSLADHGAADGGPAAAAVFNAARDFCLGPSGVAYVADAFDRRIRRIDPGANGIVDAGPGEVITTYAGGGSRGDDVPAAETSLGGVPVITCARNGDVFVFDHDAAAIRRIDSASGVISRYVGATDVVGMAVASDGALFFSVNQQGGASYIMRVDPASRIAVAIAGGLAGFAGDGGDARGARFTGIGVIAFGSDGSLYVADNGNFRIRRISFFRT